MKPSDFVAKGWCQNVSAIAPNNAAVQATDPSACRWCLTGAIVAAYPYDSLVRETVYYQLVKKLGLRFITDLIRWNDHSTRRQTDVVQLLRSIGE